MLDPRVLLDEYAAAFARGESPDLREYLVRAGGAAGELAALVDGFLARTEPQAPGEEQVALARAWADGQSPLLELRTRRGLRRDDIVAAIVRRLELDPSRAPAVGRRYTELETGLLEPHGVDGRVWDALASALGARAEALRAWHPQTISPLGPALFRAEAGAASPPPLAAPARKAGAEEPDEIDRLFGKLGG